MITLTNSVVNPAFIEGAYLDVCTKRAYDGGWFYGINDTEHWSPTATVVVIHFATGRTSVYGGEDANTIWQTLHGTPAYVESATSITLVGHGIAVSLKGSASGEFTFSWRNAAPRTDKATALLTLLVENGYVDATWLKPGIPSFLRHAIPNFSNKELRARNEGKYITVMKAT